MKYLSSSILMATVMAMSTNTFFASAAAIKPTVEASKLTVISSTAVANSASPYHTIAPGAVTTVIPSSYTVSLSTVAGNAAVTLVALNGADNAQAALADLQAPSNAVQVVVGKRGGCGCDTTAGCC